MFHYIRRLSIVSCFLILDLQENTHPYERQNNRRRSRPPSATDFLGCFEVLSTDVNLQIRNKTRRCFGLVFVSRSLYSTVVGNKVNGGRMRPCAITSRLEFSQLHCLLECGYPPASARSPFPHVGPRRGGTWAQGRGYRKGG